MVSAPAVDILSWAPCILIVSEGAGRFFMPEEKKQTQHHVGRKEYNARVDAALAMLMRGWTRRRVQKALRDGLNLPRTTAGRVVTTAYKRMLSLAGRSPDEMLGLCVSHLLKILNDADTEASPKVSAAKEIARLFGLGKSQVDITHHNAPPELTREEKVAAIMREIALAKAKASGNN